MIDTLGGDMQSQVRWKRVSIAIAIGMIAVLAASTAYANWLWRQGICVEISPDGSEKIFYGNDCDLPAKSDSIQLQEGDQI